MKWAVDGANQCAQLIDPFGHLRNVGRHGLQNLKKISATIPLQLLTLASATNPLAKCYVTAASISLLHGHSKRYPAGDTCLQ
jgi:hypothetical protein